MPSRTLEEVSTEVAAQSEVIQLLLERDRGQILLCATDERPDGCLPCDGKEYDLSVPENEKYRGLFSKIGNRYGGDGVNTFKVPELRGEFIRVWDGGRGIDKDRVIGSGQSQTTAMPTAAFVMNRVEAHSHALDPIGDHSHQLNLETTAGRENGEQANTAADFDSRRSAKETVGSGGHNHTLYPDGAHDHCISGGDRETRPRNIALAAFIRF